jgi:hypothetical protein
VHFCRGVGGMLFKPKHFRNFFWNQSDYHESCFWDDDRWVSYQLERQGFPLKVVHVPHTPYHAPTPVELALKSAMEARRRSDAAASNADDKSSQHRRLGSLTAVNGNLHSDHTCPIAWLTMHPDAYPTARTRSGKPWEDTNPYGYAADGLLQSN